MEPSIPQALSGTGALQALLLERGTPAALAGPLAAMAGQDLEVLLQAILPEAVKLQLPSGQSILARGQLPYPEGSLLRIRIQASGEGGVRLQTLEARPPSPAPLLAPLLQGEASSLIQRLSQSDPAPELQPLIQLLKQFAGESAPGPGPIEAWTRQALRVLGDPTASPREAPLHIAQSREGTGFFEIPLPWSAGNSLQIWVESDAPESSSGGEPLRRVLLGISFSRLGETRLGLVKGPLGIQVRVWTEHTELLHPDREVVEAELRSLGSPVDFQILPLPPGTPSLRALAAGPSLQALG